MEAFKKKLRALSKVRDSTANTYMYNIRRLARLAGHDTIPEKGAWLNTKETSKPCCKRKSEHPQALVRRCCEGERGVRAKYGNVVEAYDRLLEAIRQYA